MQKNKRTFRSGDSKCKRTPGALLRDTGGMEYVSSGNGTEVTVFLPAIYDMPEEGRKN